MIIRVKSHFTLVCSWSTCLSTELFAKRISCLNQQKERQGNIRIKIHLQSKRSAISIEYTGNGKRAEIFLTMRIDTKMTVLLCKFHANVVLQHLRETRISTFYLQMTSRINTKKDQCLFIKC